MHDHPHATLGFIIIGLIILFVAFSGFLLGSYFGWWGRKKYEELDDEVYEYDEDGNRVKFPQHTRTPSLPPPAPRPRPVTMTRSEPAAPRYAQREYNTPAPAPRPAARYAAPPPPRAYSAPEPRPSSDNGVLGAVVALETENPVLGMLAGADPLTAILAAEAGESMHHHSHGHHDVERVVVERVVERDSTPPYHAPEPARQSEEPSFFSDATDGVMDVADSVGKAVEDAAEGVGAAISNLFGDD
jgi:hypothetical protein